MMVINNSTLLGPCSSSYFALLLLVNSIPSLKLFGVVEALEVVLAEERTVLGLAAARHALAKVDPEIVATPFVAGDSPAGSHPRIGGD